MEPVIIGSATHIYALCDENGVVRYVGKTIRTPDKRLSQHRTAAKRSNLPVGRWLRKHPTAVVKTLETVCAGADWAKRESYWISQFDNLLNLTAGGEGLAGHTFSVEHRAKIGNALRLGANFPCETCGAVFWRRPRDIIVGNNRFCTRACYSKSLAGVSKPVSMACHEKGVAAAAAMRRAQSDCKRGHPLSGDNLFITSQGSRGCKECRKIHKRKYLEGLNG